uniref:Secreted protein n=1 Tax=Anguilla anguilla TaxID=7936 RepID=A0A0E9UV77_ANGAN
MRRNNLKSRLGVLLYRTLSWLLHVLPAPAQTCQAAVNAQLYSAAANICSSNWPQRKNKRFSRYDPLHGAFSRLPDLSADSFFRF